MRARFSTPRSVCRRRWPDLFCVVLHWDDAANHLMIGVHRNGTTETRRVGRYRHYAIMMEMYWEALTLAEQAGFFDNKPKEN